MRLAATQPLPFAVRTRHHVLCESHLPTSITAPAGSEAFAAAVPAGVLQAHAFAELYHEIFNEPERLEVIGYVTRWLQRF